MSVSETHPAPAVALLARPGAARERLREALSHADVQLVLEDDPNGLEPQVLQAADPRFVVIALEAAIEDQAVAWPLLALRLAVQLCHARRDPDLQGMRLHRSDSVFHLTVPEGWAKSYPQSAQLLRTEAVAWQKTPWTLQLHLH